MGARRRRELGAERAGRLRARGGAAAEREARRGSRRRVRRAGARDAGASRGAGARRRPRDPRRRAITSRPPTRSTTAEALAAALAAEPPDLVLTGLQSDDQGFAPGRRRARRAARRRRTRPSSWTCRSTDRQLRVKRELEGGWFQWVAMPLPAVLTIQSGINQLRYATLKGIMAAKKKDIRVVAAPRRSRPRQRIVVDLRAREGQADADDSGVAGRGREGARRARCATTRGV